ncbi:MAG: His-Xaa-Ser system protein HxsD [Bacteroidia bacterium]|nr:His-Xaa-Ser system protein HxsD [Bacteroidia bacterium]MCF8428296.1 His-Xaa-Ser system protein HxsD [Bacteroidia bacterium]MCF8446850.1 His-Xaa-Ser system protein HxsD [Bacteroidia bacterium]
MQFQNEIKSNEVIVFADASLYSKDSIFKCLYWYGDKFHTNVSFADSGTYRVSLKPISTNQLSNLELELLLQKLERDLIDFNLRDIVTKETQNVRDLLIAKAFSNGEFDEMPPGNVSDPVGFNVNKVAND